jgi:hypothetical protein
MHRRDQISWRKSRRRVYSSVLGDSVRAAYKGEERSAPGEGRGRGGTVGEGTHGRLAGGAAHGTRRVATHGCRRRTARGRSDGQGRKRTGAHGRGRGSGAASLGARGAGRRSWRRRGNKRFSCRKGTGTAAPVVATRGCCSSGTRHQGTRGRWGVARGKECDGADSSGRTESRDSRGRLGPATYGAGFSGEGASRG